MRAAQYQRIGRRAGSRLVCEQRIKIVMSDRFGEAYTFWGRARTYQREPAPDWTAILGDLDTAVGLFRAMEARPALARALADRANARRALGRAAQAADDDRESHELSRELGLVDLP